MYAYSLSREFPDQWHAVRKSIWIRDHGRCHVCEIKTNFQSTYECGHIVDRAVGGSDALDNLVAMCRTCNRAKPFHHTHEEYELWRIKTRQSFASLVSRQLRVLRAEIAKASALADRLEAIEAKALGLEESSPVPKLSLRERILAFLATSGSWLTAVEIAERIGSTPNSVKNELTRITRAGTCEVEIERPPRSTMPYRYRHKWTTEGRSDADE